MPSLFVALLALLAPSAHATPSGLADYLTFSQSSIITQHVNYNGHVGAIGGVDLANFSLVGDLDAGANSLLADGSVSGRARAPRVALTRVSGRRGGYDQTTVDRLNQASRELQATANRLNAYAATGQAEWLPNQDKALKFTASRDLEVIDLDARYLEEAKALVLEGNGHGLLLIRLRGSHVAFRGKGISISKGLQPNQIVFYFPEAVTVNLSTSGGAIDPQLGTHWGLPGAVIAPYANLSFSDISLTGQLFAGQLSTPEGLAGGRMQHVPSLLFAAPCAGCQL